MHTIKFIVRVYGSVEVELDDEEYREYLKDPENAQSNVYEGDYGCLDVDEVEIMDVIE